MPKKSPAHKPHPVTSESSSDGEDDSSISQEIQKFCPGQSRLFAPYRLVGLVSSGAGFSLISHTNSQTSMLCVPIGDRFQLIRTDKLQPVMMGQAVGTPPITHSVGDATLSITVVAHGKASISLFQRTKALDTVSLSGTLEDLLHLGRIKVPNPDKGRDENAALYVAITSNRKFYGPAVTSADDSDDDSSSSDDDSVATQERDFGGGQLVVLLATRSSLRIQRQITLPNSFAPLKVMHPSTYVNKVVVGGSDNGSPALLLYNVRTKKLIHKSKCLPKGSCTSVTSLEQSPAIDTIAVGTDRGMVHLINLRHDKKLFSLKHHGKDSKVVRITSMSFRDDASAMKYGISPMAVGRSDGSITIWDLSPPQDPNMSRVVLCTLDRVHYPGGVAKVQYMPQEPLLLSSGDKSNDLLMHIFDNPDHSGRLLKSRRGHTSPPTRIRYLFGNGVTASAVDGTDVRSCQILSSGGADRTLRSFSTARTVQDREFSQGAGLEKRSRKFGLTSKTDLLLPPLTGMALCEARRRDWGDLVTIHQDHPFAYVWSSRTNSQSGPLLRQPDWNISLRKKAPPSECHATAVTISSCGNMALVGTRGGIIYKYNIQSGIDRGCYPFMAEETKSINKKTGRFVSGDINRTMKAMEKEMKGVTSMASNLDKDLSDKNAEMAREKAIERRLSVASHSGFAVTGLAVDALNRNVISVGADAKLILWNYETHLPHRKSPYILPSPATKLLHVRESDMAAIAMEDMSVVLFDCSALTIVRRFGHHSGPVTDIGFSPDGRTLYSCSLDSTVRVHDIPTGRCVDWLGFKDPPTSLAVSPTGEYIATAHRDGVALSIWSDRSYYERVEASAMEPKEPFQMDDPQPISEGSEDYKDPSEKTSLSAMEIEKEKETNAGPVSAKDEALITMSGLPASHWKNLFHLELVKERNKPKEAPKKPPTAPFFLQWRQGEPIGQANSTALAEETPQDEWTSNWSDDDEAEEEKDPTGTTESTASKGKHELDGKFGDGSSKRQKVKHQRSHLAALLQSCKIDESFREVTNYVGTLGPSAIDIELSTLCYGSHDLEDGLPLLVLASKWLNQASASRERYEAVNAYIHRFLYLHGEIIADLRDSHYTEEDSGILARTDRIREQLLEDVQFLKKAQLDSSRTIQMKMQESLCLLRHFSRMT